jgi:hypothetical protein
VCVCVCVCCEERESVSAYKVFAVAQMCFFSTCFSSHPQSCESVCVFCVCRCVSQCVHVYFLMNSVRVVQCGSVFVCVCGE